MVENIRKSMPRIGTRKLYYLLPDQLQVMKIGRDKFFDILRPNHLLIQPKHAYSKKIMGYYVADNLNNQSSVMALKMAFKQRMDFNLPLIHHSDRGIQYCSNEYQKELIKNKVLCSMTQNSDPYENAVAERINGILKQEFMIDKYNNGAKITNQIIKESVIIYNELRPHYSNYMLTPNQMHSQNIINMRTYKAKNSSKNVFATV